MISIIKYSVIVPTHESHTAKRRSIEIVLRQLHRFCRDDAEIIVVDANSKDSTRTFLAAERSSGRISLVASPVRLSRAAARNIGAKRARGDWLLFMDDDCLLTHPIFPVLDRSLRDGAFACGALRRWLRPDWSPDELIALIEGRDPELLIKQTFVPKGIDRIAGQLDLSDCSFLTHFGLIERKRFEALGGFDEGFCGWGHEDLDLMVRSYAENERFVNLRSSIEVVHLTHPILGRVHERANWARYQRTEARLGVKFHVHRLFGMQNHGPVLVRELPKAISSKPEGISCIIATRGGLTRKRRSLEWTLLSIDRCKVDIPMEVVVAVTDDSETLDFLASFKATGAISELKWVESQEINNRSAARNIAVRASRHPLLLFMDDDQVLVARDAIQAAIERTRPRAFACGAKRYWMPIGWSPDSVQVALDEDPTILLEGCHLPMGVNRETGYRDLQEYSYIANFGLIYRDDFSALGGFDEKRFPARREDNDLMYRALLSGLGFVCLFDCVETIHLTHPIAAERPDERLFYHRLFDEWQAENGFRFKANHLFGVFEEDGTEILEPIQQLVESRTSGGDE